MLPPLLAISLAGCSGDEVSTSSGLAAAATSAPAASTAIPAPTSSPAKPPLTPADSVVDPSGQNRDQSAQSATASPAPLLGTRGGGATLVQLVDPLDEPEFYCVDVPGFGPSLDLAAALSAHTCKPGADDELFQPGSPLPGNLQMPAYQLCMAAAAAEPGAKLLLNDCSDSPLQRFSLDAEGSLRLADSTLCLAVAPGAGQATGGPSHVRRELGLQDCETVPEQRRRWQLPGPGPA